ncbi:alpha/beta hydrolase [Dyella koreensis]|uniref:Alpha/beta hydrolase n=1 Tax=Dyella koreensis TaxID=311235 RepID=A0ABW8K5X3_9GAMM
MSLRVGIWMAALLLIGAWAAHASERLTVPRADGAQTPLQVYEPVSANGCPPLLLVSHGAGGSESGLRYVGEAMSKDGWRVLVMGHRESGLPVLKQDMRSDGFKGGLTALVTDAPAYKARFMDVDAALAWSEQRCHASFKALLGHSMGAITVMLEAGARNKLGLQPKGGFDAYVALSQEGPGPVFPDGAWAPIRAPMLLVTGTRDQGLGGDYRWRMQAFDGLSPGCRWLAVVDGANHMNFGGGQFAAGVQQSTTTLVAAYLDALRGGHCGTPPVLSGVTVKQK